MLGCSMTTMALGLIDNEINLKFGESVACHWLWWCGTQSHSGIEDERKHEIFGVDVNESLGDMVLDLGADYFLYNVDALQHVDVVIDTTGNPSVIGKEIWRANPNWSFDSCGTTSTKDGNCNSKCSLHV